MGRMVKLRAKWYAVAAMLIGLSPTAVLAAGIPEKIVPCTGTDCTVCSIATLAQNILNFGIFLAVVISAFLFAWAGILYMRNESPGEISRAKSIFMNVIIGLVIILAAWLLIDTIMYTFTGSHMWSQLC